MPDDFFRYANYAEAALWAVIGGACLLVGRSRKSAVRRRYWSAAPWFILFGVSDVIEAGTGAWWRPWWLLAWKAACVVALAGIGVAALRRRAR